MSKVQTAPLSADVQRRIEALRVKNQVSAVKAEQEGAALGTLPDRVYGFTYSPLNASTPLFGTRTLACFEVHKLSGGVVHLLGFLKPSEAAAVEEGVRAAEVNLYPEPWGDAQSLVEVPLERIVRAKPLSRSEGNYMPLHLDAA
jgi:hypothetical protein